MNLINNVAQCCLHFHDIYAIIVVQCWGERQKFPWDVTQYVFMARGQCIFLVTRYTCPTNRDIYTVFVWHVQALCYCPYPILFTERLHVALNALIHQNVSSFNGRLTRKLNIPVNSSQTRRYIRRITYRIILIVARTKTFNNWKLLVTD